MEEKGKEVVMSRRTNVCYVHGCRDHSRDIINIKWNSVMKMTKKIVYKIYNTEILFLNKLSKQSQIFIPGL